MREAINLIFDDGFDGISFMPTSDDFDEIDINGFDYTTKSKYDKFEMGYKYHIFLYKCNDRGQVNHIDIFDAILTDPRVYTFNVIKCDFFGVIAKKTKKSKKIIKEIHDRISKYYVSEETN